MKFKPRAYTRSLLGFNGAFIVAVLTAAVPPVFAASTAEEIKNAVVDKFEQTSRPLFDPEGPAQSEKPKADPFFDKLRKEHRRFDEKEQERQREFVQKVRVKNWAHEKRQKEIQNFNQEKIKRQEKFRIKEQKKISKHLEKIS